MNEYNEKGNPTGKNPAADTTPRGPRVPPQPGPDAQPKKVRRVGTFTFGLVLVAAGVLLALRTILPQLDLSFIASLAPLALIVLGVEVLIYAARPDVKLKYDGVSMFVCFVMLVLVGSASTINELWSDYGPAASMMENRMESWYEQQVSDLLAAQPELKQNICDVSVWADLNHPYDEAASAGIQAGDRLNVTLTLRDGAYPSAGEFAAMARQVMDLCKQGGIPATGYSFVNQEKNPANGMVTYSLEVEGAWQMQATAEMLAQDVYQSYWYDGTSYSSYDSMQDYRRQMIRENLSEEYYDEFGETPSEEWLDEQMASMATAESAGEVSRSAPSAPAAPEAPDAPEYTVEAPAGLDAAA